MSQMRWQNQAWGVLFALIGGVACEDDDSSATEHDEVHGAAGASAAGHSSSDKPAGVSETKQQSASADPLVVEVESGKLEGAWVKDGAVRSFLGVPYAQPPVGDLRFKAPQKPKAWKDVRAAKEYGGRCAQLESTVLMNAASDNEDCLYLNVWAPKAASSSKKLPVMFWIHGGGNVNGSTSEPVPYATSEGYFYTGENLAAEQEVLVVSLNYRLGVFGFLAHEQLKKDGARSGNQGLWDQVFALQWVQKNIEAFGGDPKQVTIFGESAGSLDVCAHVASPQSRGLFARAISESGGCTTQQVDSSAAEGVTKELAEKVGCNDAAAALDCLRKKSVGDLLTAAGKVTSGRFGPNIDGEDGFWPDQPRSLFERGDIAKVPYILGSNTDEGTLFTTGTTVTSQSELEAAIKQAFSVPVEDVLKHYPMADFAKEAKPYQAAFARIVGDARLVCPTYDSAVWHASTGAPTFMYNFDIPANIPGFGATHGAELVYVFGTSSSLNDEQKAAAKNIRNYWGSLAKHGDPNKADQLEWPGFGDKHPRLNFGLKTTVVSDFRAAQCDFWRGVYSAQFGKKP